jgi:hypothetical protein
MNADKREGLTVKIYIASSWKNRHAVELLTLLLRKRGYTVLSFVENENFESAKSIPFAEWVWSEMGARSFEYDTRSASTADFVIYIGPSGCDAWAEVGLAIGKGVPVYGLWGKDDQIGLMRRLVNVWFKTYAELLDNIPPAIVQVEARKEV